MSKTWQRVYSCTDYHPRYTSWAKRQANKAVRNHPDVPQHREFKKLYCSWDIRDWNFHVWPAEAAYLAGKWNDEEMVAIREGRVVTWVTWEYDVAKNERRKKKFPRYGRRDRKRARREKGFGVPRS